MAKAHNSSRTKRVRSANLDPFQPNYKKPRLRLTCKLCRKYCKGEWEEKFEGEMYWVSQCCGARVQKDRFIYE